MFANCPLQGELTLVKRLLAFRVFSAAAMMFAPCATSMALNVNVGVNGNINHAIQQVNAAGGGTVTLAAGNWTINSSINMLSNVTLVGAGESSTSLVATGGFNVIQETADGESNMAVKNLNIVGVSSSTSSNGVYIDAGSTYNSNITISGVQVENCGGIGCQLKRCNTFSITGCDFESNGMTDLGHNLYCFDVNSGSITNDLCLNSPMGSGIHLNTDANGGTCDNVTISGNVCSGNGQDGMDIMGTLANDVIASNTVNYNSNADMDGGWGIRIWTGSGDLHDNVAQGNAVGSYNVWKGWTQENNITHNGVPTIAFTAPSSTQRVMANQALAAFVTGNVGNSVGTAPLNVNLTSTGSLSVTSLNPASSSVAAGSSTTFIGTLNSGSNLGSQGFQVTESDSTAMPTSMAANGTVDVLGNRVISAGSVTFLAHVNGNATANTTLSSTLGDDTSMTRLTVNGRLFNGSGSTTTQSVTSPTFNTAGNSSAIMGTVTDVAFTSISGEGLTGETDQSSVNVPYAANVFNGSATSTNVGNYSALNWTDSNGVQAVPGTFAGFTSTDSATFNGTGGTVTLNVAPSLNILAFNNNGSYTLAGTNTLSLAGTSPTPTVSVTGNHAISAALTLVNNTTVTTNSTGSNLSISGKINGSGKLTAAGSGTLTLSGSNSYGGGTSVTGGTLNIESPTALPSSSTLSVSSGAKLVVNRNGGSKITISLASLSDRGLIDLQNNAMTISGSNASTYTAINGLLKAGYTNGGNWSGSTGITSSTLGGSTLYTLGEALNGSTLTVGYAYYGDADMSGHVDGNDYSMIDFGFGGAGTGWQYGDFNYDGVVDGSDYSLIDNAFNTQAGSAPAAQIATNTTEIAAPAGSAAVPEPASLGLLGIGALGLLSRRRV
jgi:fibronectin-binding autotransporter adhesin